MRPKLPLLLAALGLIGSCGGASGGDTYRRMDGLDLRVFSCSSEPGYHQYSSVRELNVALKRMSKGCPNPDYKDLRAAFLTGLERGGVRWEMESLVILEEASGTGAAAVQLEVSAPSADTVKAALVWTTSTTPATADAAVARFAFTVDRSLVRKVTVSGRDADEKVLSIAP